MTICFYKCMRAKMEIFEVVLVRDDGCLEEGSYNIR
jgi:hypothetical protein